MNEREVMQAFVADILRIRLFMLTVECYHPDPSKLQRFWRSVGTMLDHAFTQAATHVDLLQTSQAP